MSEQIKDGGPAFPVNYSNENDGPTVMPTLGLSMRDYFAAKALQALIGHESKDYFNRGPKAVPKLAAWAYEYADAMIAAREVTK